MACVAVGPVINKNIAMNISLTVTSVKPDCKHIPRINKSIPPESVTEAACNLDQKSRNLKKPIEPVKIKKHPRIIDIQLTTEKTKSILII